VLLRHDLTSSWLGSRSYWDAAYAAGRYSEEYEWLQSCETIWPHLQGTLPQHSRSSCRLLHVGCGNSRLGRVLHDAGFLDVTNVDYSARVVAMMRCREPALHWRCLDCSVPGALGEPAAYDACVDKGALDSLFEAGTQRARERGCRMVAEVHRALRPGGRYVLFSNAAAGLDALREEFAEVSCEALEGYSCDLYYRMLYLIVCMKQ